MKVYMIRDKRTDKYVSLASKHRKFYCHKANALNATNNTWPSARSCYEVEEFELHPVEERFSTKHVKLGDFVRYHSYYVKDKNGIYIETNNFNSDREGLIEWAYAVDGEERIELNFEGDGIMKPLFREVNRDGTGVVIDTRTIPTKEFLYSDIIYIYEGSERRIITKQHTAFVNCVKVAYCLGKTRWVPVESLY